MALKILFLVPYTLGKSPSQRFRFEQYFPIIKHRGWDYEVRPFYGSINKKYFLESGQKKGIISFFFKGIWRRFLTLFFLKRFDVIFIHREAAPLGPAFFEFVIARAFSKRIIYDFDDAIWLSDRLNESWLFRALKWRSKVIRICRLAYKVSCGNHYLADFARKYTPNVVYNPTTIDTENLHNRKLYGSQEKNERIVIGWTGSFSTLKYLREVEGVIREIQHTFAHVDLLVIADKRPELDVPRMEFVPWNIESEIQDLMRIDIGIMPLTDNEWSKGKCGFKILQYMALEMPVVASAVGVNVEIIEDGVDGFLARSSRDWVQNLSRLVLNSDLRTSLGKRGRKKVKASYSVNSNAATFFSLFE